LAAGAVLDDELAGALAVGALVLGAAGVVLLLAPLLPAPDELSVVAVVLDELAALLFEPPEYRSEYQPPPFRMKFPDWICRFARGSWQLGQSFAGSAVIRCTSSNSWQQASQR
jgi:hypothetical protein